MEYIYYFLRCAADLEKERIFFRNGTNDLQWRAWLYWQAADFARLDIIDREPDNKELISQAVSTVTNNQNTWQTIQRGLKKN